MKITYPEFLQAATDFGSHGHTSSISFQSTIPGSAPSTKTNVLRATGPSANFSAIGSLLYERTALSTVEKIQTLIESDQAVFEEQGGYGRATMATILKSQP